MRRHQVRCWLLACCVFLSLLSCAASLSHAETVSTEIMEFSRNLQSGMTHPDVKRLQEYLNRQAFNVSQQGAGSPGKETTYFGARTKAAVQLFQKAHGLPSTGYFGPLSRNTVRAQVLKNVQTVTSSSPPKSEAVVPQPAQTEQKRKRGSARTAGTAPSDTTAPTTPGTLTARASDSSSIRLSWTASTDASSTVTYVIYRDGVSIGETTATSYTDTGRTSSTTYAYYVKAKDSDLNTSSASRTVYSKVGTWDDGFADAPEADIPYPTLLNAYVAAPPWKVAGVDYAVGVPESTTLLSPSTIALAGVTVNEVSRLVTVSGSNITLDGYDFSENGGYQVYVTGSNVTITRSNFLIGANDNPPIVLRGSGGGTISYNTIDGSDSTITAYTGLINNYGTGTYTITYNWFKNAYSDFINAGSSTQSQVIRYNVMENAGAGNSAGAHGDWLQNYGASNTFPSVDVSFNTMIQNADDRAAQGFNLSANQGPTYTRFDTVQFRNNTVVLPNEATVDTNINYVFIIDPSEVTESATVDENYVDATGAYYGWESTDSTGRSIYSGTTTLSNNIDMLTGDALSGQGTTIPIRTTLTSPSAGDILYGDSVTLTATAASSDGVTSVQFKANNTLINAADTSEPYSTVWDSTGVSDGEYTIYSVARDPSGRFSTSSAAVTVLNNPPVISSISSGTPTTTGTTISWSTNSPATSRVVYGLTSSYGFSTTSTATTTSHSMLITGLTASTQYHYAVVSADARGQTSTSSDQTFTTEASSSYDGPGDIAASASAWWGLRSYSRARVGESAVTVTCGGTDYTITTLIDGTLDVSTLSSSCGVQTIYLKQLIDQTGNGYHMSQSLQARQATIILNCIGALPCIRSTTSSTYTTSGLTATAPVTMVFGLKPSAYTAQSNIFSSSNGQTIYQSAADTITTYDAKTTTHTVTDGSWHAIQSLVGNYTNDAFTVDTTTTPFVGGSAAPGVGGGTASFLSFTSNGYGFRGDAVEGGIWSGAFAGATTTAMYGNIDTYWNW